jgi:hypothetical protein
MTREEELIRSTTHAIASSVREVPPLRLEPAADEQRSPARAPRRARGSRWRSWAAPVTAAALVVALAIALVVIKDLPNGGAVPQNAPTATAGPDGAPRYFVALKVDTQKLKPPTDNYTFDIVVGDSLTGKTLATLAPPARTTFQSVTAAADDRTFVIFAVTSNGSFNPGKGVTLTGSWYKLRLDPGTANPARLSKLPIKPWSWAASYASVGTAPGEIYGTALSGSGQELAVADVPDVPAADTPANWQEVKVFSVATGHLLHDWTENAPRVSFTFVSASMAGVPAGTPPLTWIDGDHALTVATAVAPAAGVETGTLRRLNVTGPASGNLMTDSTVIRSGTLPWNQSGECFNTENWPPQISADGKTINCVTVTMPYATPGQLNFYTYPLTPADGRNGTIDYRAAIPPEKETGGGGGDILYVSPSAGTLIVMWVNGGGLSTPQKAYFGVVSHGTFIRLPIPASMAASTVADITF